MVARDGGSYNGALSGGDDDGGFEFTTAMAVLVTLVCMFVVLAALFVRTSSKRQQQPSMGLRRRRRSYDDDDDDEIASVGKGSSISIGNVMCRDDDVEMDVACVERDLRVMKSRNDDDGDETDYSVGGFSVSIAVTGGGGEGGAQQHKWSRFITGSKSFGSGVGRSFIIMAPATRSYRRSRTRQRRRIRRWRARSPPRQRNGRITTPRRRNGRTTTMTTKTTTPPDRLPSNLRFSASSRIDITTTTISFADSNKYKFFVHLDIITLYKFFSSH